MPVLQTIVQVGIYIIMTVSVIAAFGAVSLPNVFHAALALMVTLIGTAGLYVALQADFLAVVQILLYVGAVMTLVIFSIMMTEKISDQAIPQRNHLFLPALAGVIVFWGLLVRTLCKTPWVKSLEHPVYVSVSDLGKHLLTRYAFPFEVISVFLIAAMIGAIVVAKKDKP